MYLDVFNKVVDSDNFTVGEYQQIGQLAGSQGTSVL